MLRFMKNTHSFHDLVEGLTGLRKTVITQLQFTAVKTYSFKAARRKGAEDRVQEIPRQGF